MSNPSWAVGLDQVYAAAAAAYALGGLPAVEAVREPPATTHLLVEAVAAAWKEGWHVVSWAVVDSAVDRDPGRSGFKHRRRSNPRSEYVGRGRLLLAHRLATSLNPRRSVMMGELDWFWSFPVSQQAGWARVVAGMAGRVMQVGDADGAVRAFDDLRGWVKGSGRGASP